MKEELNQAKGKYLRLPSLSLPGSFEVLGAGRGMAGLRLPKYAPLHDTWGKERQEQRKNIFFIVRNADKKTR